MIAPRCVTSVRRIWRVPLHPGGQNHMTVKDEIRRGDYVTFEGASRA